MPNSYQDYQYRLQGGNIVWDKNFGYANINDSTLVDKNTMFILSSALKP